MEDTAGRPIRRVNDTEWGDLWPDEIESVKRHNPGITPAETRRRIARLNAHCARLLWGRKDPMDEHDEFIARRRRELGLEE